MTTRAGRAWCAALVLALALTADVSVSAASLAVRPASTLTPSDLAGQAFDRMTPAQRIGQLFMVGGPVTGIGAAAATAISTYHVGNLILTGRTTGGAPPVRVVTAGADKLATSAATSGVPLFISADQEGGFVQALRGPGFSTMPAALVQGSWTDSTLTRRATAWGHQMFWAGVNLDLAPVMDTVPATLGAANPPIGTYDREYGHTPSVVAAKGAAFVRGMTAGGALDLAVTAKHFPGLGHVRANTDTTAGVRDTVITRTSADLGPFRSAVAAGARFVMVSSAVYTKIDASLPAVFSPTVVTGMLRDDLKFDGVVISDDVGSAKAVAAWSPGSRAVRFLAAGGDVVLTVDPALIPAMTAAVAARAAADRTFQTQIDAATRRVLTVKALYGLLAPRLGRDGVLGATTVDALQRWLGLAPTGVLDAGTTIRLQTRIGSTADGVWGPASMAALQSFLGTYRDGARTWNSRTVGLLQAYLNTEL